jgi:hypothetical protein
MKPRPPAGPPQQAAPSATGKTVAECAQKDPKRADREREKLQQRKQAAQAIKTRPSASFDMYEFAGSDTLQIVPTLPTVQ